jgi:hypothetical protein
MAKPLTASQKAAVAAEKARQAAAAAKKNKPKPTPSAGRRVNPKAAKPKPAAAKPAARPALPPGRQGGPLATRPGTRPALPPGRQGGAVVRQGNAKPENPRRTNARNRQATAGRGTTGPGRVGQPAGSANRMYGANVVNNSVNRAIASTRLANLSKAAGGVALPAAIATQAMNVVGGFQKLANHPFLKGKGGKPAPSAGRRTSPKAAKPAKPKPNMDRPGLRYEKLADTRAPRSAYGLTAAPTAPKPKPAAKPTSASAPSRPAARPSAKPKPTPKPKAPAKAKPPAASATSAERRVSASTSNRESGNYGTSKTNNPLMKDMVARMKAREDKAQAAAASKLTYKPNKDSGYTPKDKVKGSKDYSSQFKDMKGGSSRFAAELKKKKGYKLF